ncbi:MAG: TetR/AcrR family transcriptional regulator [Marinilabiliaceae bacterium]|nr:TetR/AcrR family transcriptional regulator [Marinilabiliaceae bacterium]
MKHDNNNEQLILEAAEIEFLENGFKNASTTAIAKRAGVTHAMLHYYYRTKENLFKKVFQEKVQILANSFDMVFHENDVFEDIIRNFIEKYFDFIAKNPHLESFIYNEITSNADSKKLVLEVMRSKSTHIVSHFEKLIEDEVAKRTIRHIKIEDLLLNILSLNVFTFMAMPIIKDLMPNQPNEYFENFLIERKENIVQFILNALRM